MGATSQFAQCQSADFESSVHTGLATELRKAVHWCWEPIESWELWNCSQSSEGVKTV